MVSFDGWKAIFVLLLIIIYYVIYTFGKWSYAATLLTKEPKKHTKSFNAEIRISMCKCVRIKVEILLTKTESLSIKSLIISFFSAREIFY